jgi:hypothetical protein
MKFAAIYLITFIIQYCFHAFKVTSVMFIFIFFSFQGTAFQSLLPAVRDKIIESFTPEARDMFEREFDFFDKVTSISGVLFPLPKDERRAGIRR